VKRHAATFSAPRKHPVGHTGMQMHMQVECRAEPVLERDCTQPRAGLSRCVTLSWHIRRIAKQLFDLFQKHL
jgi:hypothetical protein